MISDWYPFIFPDALQVLAYSEDIKNVLLYANYLYRFKYRVWTASKEAYAMDLLCNQRRTFDIILMEVYKPEGHIFQLISEIAQDIPIIIISKDDSIESVIKWMSIGACDYLIPPIRPEDIKFMFKHLAKNMKGKKNMRIGLDLSVPQHNLNAPQNLDDMNLNPQKSNVEPQNLDEIMDDLCNLSLKL